MKYLLDTDHISFLQRRSGPEYLALSSRLAKHRPDDFAFSVVSFHEQALGANTYINRAKSSIDVVSGYELLGQVLAVYMTATVLPFDARASIEFSSVRAQRIRIPTMDLRIASIALSNNLILLTRNAVDFGKVPNLVTEDWTI